MDLVNTEAERLKAELQGWIFFHSYISSAWISGSIQILYLAGYCGSAEVLW